jgi:hypothetical protein
MNRWHLGPSSHQRSTQKVSSERCAVKPCIATLSILFLSSQFLLLWTWTTNNATVELVQFSSSLTSLYKDRHGNHKNSDHGNSRVENSHFHHPQNHHHRHHHLRTANEDSASTRLRKKRDNQRQYHDLQSSSSSPPPPQMPIPTSTNPNRPYRKWAYAFLMGGCNPNRPEEYRGFLYNILVSADILQHHGSTADVVVMVQLAYQNTTRTTTASTATTVPTSLPADDVRLLHAMNIKIHYLPAPSREQNFYSVVLEKFRILQLVQYSRVLFVDGDAWPLCNLDYLFDLSEPLPKPKQQLILSGGKGRSPTTTTTTKPLSTIQLKENIVLAWKSEPSNAGFFLMEPSLQKFKDLQRIISNRQAKALTLPWPHFDPDYGWGHVIGGDRRDDKADNGNDSPRQRKMKRKSVVSNTHQVPRSETILAPPNDHWRGFNNETGTKWTWYGVHGGQGLLYYFTKYHLQSVSLIIGDEIEQWTHVWEEEGNEQNGGDILDKHQEDTPLVNATLSQFIGTSPTTPFAPRSRRRRHLVLEETLRGNVLMTEQYSCLPPYKDMPGEYGSHPRLPTTFQNIAPYRDFHHAVGRNKPWEHWEWGDASNYDPVMTYDESHRHHVQTYHDTKHFTPPVPQDVARNAVAVSWRDVG